MMHRRTQLVVLVLMATAFLGGLFLVSYAGQSRVLQSSQLVKAAMQRKQTEAQIVSSLLDAETSLRGFVLTDGPEYLAPYEKATASIEPLLNKLLASFAPGSDDRFELLRRVRLLVGTKLGDMNTTLTLYRRGGLAPALAVMQTDVGKKSMDELRALLGQLAAFEQREIDSADAAWSRNLWLGRLVAGIGATLNVVLLLVAASLIARNARRQDELNRTLREQKDSLQVAVDQRTSDLSDLAINLQNVAESEKAALARELHDDLGGTLTGAKMDLSWLRKRVATDDADLVVRWDRLERALETGINFKRRVVEQLRPTLLDNLGLYAAARWLAEETCAAADLELTLDLAEPEPVISKNVGIALFRVLQEALTNVVKHAHAHHVEVTLEPDEAANRLRMLVRDDGRGIAASHLKAFGSHGLGSMRQRLLAVGGTFEVRALGAGGTEVVALVPLVQRELSSADSSATSV
jgi:signal transduction histidine kinase